MTNRKAFLDMIAVSEGTLYIPGGGDGYKVIVGSTMSVPGLDGELRRPSTQMRVEQ